MNRTLFLSAFVSVFIAELGDKTQLATLALASQGKSRLIVFAGSALALVASSTLAVLAGEALARTVPPTWIKRAAGALFLVLGAIMLWPSSDAS